MGTRKTIVSACQRKELVADLMPGRGGTSVRYFHAPSRQETDVLQHTYPHLSLSLSVPHFLLPFLSLDVCLYPLKYF